MRALKVVTLLVVLMGAALAAEEAAPMEVETVEMVDKQPDKETTKETEGSTKSPEKRGLYRFTGVHGENVQPYQTVLYTVPQSLQQPLAPHYHEPRAAATSPGPAALPSKYEYKPYPTAYTPQATYQQQYVMPSPLPTPLHTPLHTPIPYNVPMLLLMTPPHPGNPYGSLMLLPASNFLMPNHILPYHGQGRVPITFVPQYVPVPVKSLPSAHFKGEYPQKPTVQYQPPTMQYQTQYQEQPSSEEDASVMTSANYGTRVRPVEQYVKGG